MRKKRYTISEVKQIEPKTYTFEVAHGAGDRDLIRASHFKVESDKLMFYGIDQQVVGIVRAWTAVFREDVKEKTPE